MDNSESNERKMNMTKMIIGKTLRERNSKKHNS